MNGPIRLALIGSLAALATPAVFATPAVSLTATPSPQQRPLAWDFQYVHQPSPTLEPLDLVATDDGGALMLARTAASASGVFECVLTSVDENGDQRWNWSDSAVALWGPSRAALALDSNGLAYVVTPGGSSSRLRCFGPDGSILWMRFLGPPSGGTA